MGRRKGGRCSCCRWTGHEQGIPTDLVCGGTLKVTFCQAARLPRQGMDPNANVGYRSCFVPSCLRAVAVAAVAVATTEGVLYSVRNCLPQVLHFASLAAPTRQEGARQVQRYLCIYSYRTCCM